MTIGRIPGATGIQPTIVDAKGDIIAATAADSVTRLVAGANETRLVADSAEATGLKYVADTTNYAVAAKGDLLAGTAADTVAALTVGSDHSVLQALASETTGLKYANDLTTFTPTWTGSVTNPVLGNGTLEGKYMRTGKQCFAKYRMVAGSTTTFGSGDWIFSLPFAAQLDGINIGVIAGGYSEDNGVAGYRIFGAIINTSNQLRVQAGTTISPYSSTNPFTWGNTDYLQFAIVYEVD
jgi:hypothetical protein